MSEHRKSTNRGGIPGGENEKNGEQNHIGLSQRKPRDHSKYIGLQKPTYYTIIHVDIKTLEHTYLTQCSVNKGLQVFG